jgi:lipopolysaccharide export system permease protein
MTLMVFTFVMYVGAVIKAIDLMARGVNGQVILKIFLFNIPYIMSFSIPISTITAVLLLFSRLSFDGEITAMRAGGLAMWQICSPVIFVAVLLAMACIYINAVAAPDSHFARRKLLHNVGFGDPLEMLEPGRFVKDFPGINIYVGSKVRNRIYDVIVYELGPSGVRRRIRAESGVITPDPDNQKFIVDLYKVRIDDAPDKDGEESFAYIAAEHYVEELEYGEMIGSQEVQKRSRDFTLPELVRGIVDVRTRYPELEEGPLLRHRMELMVEASERLAMSFSCIAFALIGIPLGMKSRRKESSVGIAISLVVVFVFYFFVILAESLVEKPYLRPDFLVWIPVFTAQFIGLRLLRKLDGA